MKGKVVHYGKGIWGPSFEKPYGIIGNFLLADVGRSLKECDSYKFAGLDVAAGKKRTFEIHGNLVVLRIMPTWVLMTDLFGGKESPEPVVISMDACLSILRYWRAIAASWDRRNAPADQSEFSYDDPAPMPPISPDEAARVFQATVIDSRLRHEREKE